MNIEPAALDGARHKRHQSQRGRPDPSLHRGTHGRGLVSAGPPGRRHGLARPRSTLNLNCSARAAEDRRHQAAAQASGDALTSTSSTNFSPRLTPTANRKHSKRPSRSGAANPSKARTTSEPIGDIRRLIATFLGLLERAGHARLDRGDARGALQMAERQSPSTNSMRQAGASPSKPNTPSDYASPSPSDTTTSPTHSMNSSNSNRHARHGSCTGSCSGRADVGEDDLNGDRSGHRVSGHLAAAVGSLVGGLPSPVRLLVGLARRASIRVHGRCCRLRARWGCRCRLRSHGVYGR